MSIDQILVELVDALIVECPGALPAGLELNLQFQRICGICDDLGYYVATYPAVDIFVIEISEAPNGGLIAPVEVLRAKISPKCIR